MADSRMRMHGHRADPRRGCRSANGGMNSLRTNPRGRFHNSSIEPKTARERGYRGVGVPCSAAAVQESGSLSFSLGGNHEPGARRLRRPDGQRKAPRRRSVRVFSLQGRSKFTDRNSHIIDSGYVLRPCYSRRKQAFRLNTLRHRSHGGRQ